MDRPIPTDAELAARIRGGDADALGVVFHACYGQLIGYARRIARDDAIAEEMVMDVFRRVWEQRASFTVRGSIRTYLFSAVHHAAQNYTRDDTTRARLLATAPADAPPAVGTAPSSPVADVERAELRQAIEAVVATFSDRVRHAYALRWEQGLTVPEIAEVMGVSGKAAEQYLVRAARALRGALRHFRES